MKITYLGTAASEGWPAEFCECDICRAAMKRGGLDWRLRSCALIDDDLLIDVSPDIYASRVKLDVSLAHVRAVLITHSHADHFAIQQLGWAMPNFAPVPKHGPLLIAGSEGTYDAYRQLYAAWGSRFTEGMMNFEVLKPFQPTDILGARVTLLPAEHGAKGASVYLIERDGRRIAYMHDTGVVLPEVWDYFKTLDRPLDLVSLDAVCGPNRAGEHSGHMGFEQDAEIRGEMLRCGIANEQTRFISNHICIHSCKKDGKFYFHEDMEAFCKPLGLTPSYDGMTITVG